MTTSAAGRLDDPPRTALTSSQRTFVDGGWGWDVKRIVRLLVTRRRTGSRRGTPTGPLRPARTRTNRLLARQDRHSLDAESGREKRHGPGPAAGERPRGGGPCRSRPAYQPAPATGLPELPVARVEKRPPATTWTARGWTPTGVRTFLHPGDAGFDAPQPTRRHASSGRAPTRRSRPLACSTTPSSSRPPAPWDERGLRDGGKEDGERLAYLFRRVPLPE